jgi:hypothetical protein
MAVPSPLSLYVRRRGPNLSYDTHVLVPLFELDREFLSGGELRRLGSRRGVELLNLADVRVLGLRQEGKRDPSARAQ